jgi:hypothetical protein
MKTSSLAQENKQDWKITFLGIMTVGWSIASLGALVVTRKWIFLMFTVGLVLIALCLIYPNKVMMYWNKFFPRKKLTSTSNKASTRKSTEHLYIKALGLFIGLWSVFLVYVALNEPATSSDFLGLLVSGVCGIGFSFALLSPWKKINYLIGGLGFIAIGALILGTTATQDTWLYATISFLIGLGLLLRTANLTFSSILIKALGSPAFIATIKVFKWIGICLIVLALISVGLLLIGGFISLIGGLSATTIIIILLVLIWLK